MAKSTKTRIVNSRKTRLISSCIFAWVIMFVIAFAVSSCNVTRKVTTVSEYHTKGDTSIVIQTKTIETYDATKKLPTGY